MNAMQRARQQAGAWWQRLAPRERLWVALGTGGVALAVLWWIALSPALSTLRSAATEQARLDAQLQRMQSLRQQALGLQKQPRQNPDEAMRALELAVRQILGTTARMTVAGERVTVTLAGTPPDTLAQWLTQARVNARTLPSEARLIRNASGGWDGTITLALPPR